MQRDSMRKVVLAALIVFGSSTAQAAEFSFDGYADLRAIFPSNEVGGSTAGSVN